MVKRFILICQSCCAAFLTLERFDIKSNQPDRVWLMKPSQAATILGMGASTIRAWSMGEFKPYLSPTAQGGSGRNRDLTELDVRIIGYINRLKQQSVPLEEIHANVKRLQEEDWRDLPLLPDVAGVSGVSNVAVVPKAAHDMALDAERKSLLKRDQLPT